MTRTNASPTPWIAGSVKRPGSHESFGIYGQGVALSTAVLPSGWQDRLVAFVDPAADPSDARCLDPHDLVVSKLVAGREKDHDFARSPARRRVRRR